MGAVHSSVTEHDSIIWISKDPITRALKKQPFPKRVARIISPKKCIITSQEKMDCYYQVLHKPDWFLTKDEVVNFAEKTREKVLKSFYKTRDSRIEQNRSIEKVNFLISQIESLVFFCED